MIEFKEVQRFKIWWIWLAITALHVLFIYAIIQQVIFDRPFGSKPASDLALMIIELGLMALLFFLVSIKLKTRITEIGIYYRFYPFQFKETLIEWHELKDAYIREYHSFYEYGGWGIRVGSSKVGRAINTSASSNKGLQLEFNDGQLLLIGTRRSQELKVIVEEMTATGKINRRV